jgi:hypothetical protein
MSMICCTSYGSKRGVKLTMYTRVISYITDIHEGRISIHMYLPYRSTDTCHDAYSTVSTLTLRTFHNHCEVTQQSAH